MNPGFAYMNDKRYIVPQWIEVDNTVTFENIWDYIPEEKPRAPMIQTFPVEGRPYIITVNNGKISCNCSGFQFRRKCKHAEAFKGVK